MYNPIGSDNVTESNEKKQSNNDEMDRLTIRLKKKDKKEMQRRKDVNWPEKLRGTISKETKKDKIVSEVTNIVQINKDDMPLMRTFYLYSVIYEQMYRPLSKNMEVMFEEKGKEIEQKMLNMFENIGITDRSDRTDNDVCFYDVLLQSLFDEHIIEKIEDHISANLKEHENIDELAGALWYLEPYLRHDTDLPYTVFQDRHLEILFSHVVDDPGKIIHELNSLGIIYYDYTNTNAYNHKNYKIPIYSYKLIKHIREYPYHYSNFIYTGESIDKIRELLKEPRYRNFIKNFKSYDTVITIEESEILKDSFNFNNQPFNFDNVLNDLVRCELLTCTYWAGRSRAGRRSSRAPETRYKLSEEGKGLLSNVLIETIVKNAENKGELEYLVEEFEKKINKKNLKSPS